MVALHSPDRFISIVVPALNEAGWIGECLSALRLLGECEIIVVDGGSVDGTREEAGRYADRVIESPPGRAIQMNAGALAARGSALWFVHADTFPPPGSLEKIRLALGNTHSWGRFDVRLDGRHAAFRVIERFINWRSALSGIATGDQAIFMTRQAFDAVCGYPEIPLMEDVAISTALKARARPRRIREPVVSSSRRWETQGILRTTLLMWRLRYAYWRGADPEYLARWYRTGRQGKAR